MKSPEDTDRITDILSNQEGIQKGIPEGVLIL